MQVLGDNQNDQNKGIDDGMVVGACFDFRPRFQRRRSVEP